MFQLVLAFQSVSAEVAAHPQTPAAQIDRINIGPTVVKCQQAWPNYERSCLQGRNELPGKIRTVRLIAVDPRASTKLDCNSREVTGGPTPPAPALRHIGRHRHGRGAERPLLIRINAIRLMAEQDPGRQEHPTEHKGDVRAAAALTVATTEMARPPRSGATPKPASRIAPSTATTKAEASERKKLSAPIATPTWWCGTAFWIDTVVTGNTRPTAVPTIDSTTITVESERSGRQISSTSEISAQQSPITARAC